MLRKMFKRCQFKFKAWNILFITVMPRGMNYYLVKLFIVLDRWK